MNIDKVVYLVQTPFLKRDNDRFGVDIFLNHNIEVMVLGITAYLDKYVVRNYVLDSKITYDKLPDYWSGRKFIMGDTINLVKNSKLCLLHASTSVNFAVLYNKPIILVTMNEIKKSNVQIRLEAMLSELNSTVADLENFNQNKILDIDYSQDNYNNYKKKYIKSLNGLDINNWELLYKYYTNK